MADNKSSEVYETLEKDLELYFEYEQNFTDQAKLEKLTRIAERIRGVTYILGMEDERLIEFRKKVFDLQADIIAKLGKKPNTSKLNISIDCSDAIKGLKAVQREARKTVAALKEVEEYKTHISER